MRKRFLLLVSLGLCLILSSLQAQNIEEYLSRYTEGNGQKYMQPLADAFCANLNSGFFWNAKVPEKGFHLTVGFVTTAALISDKQRTFEATTEDPFTPQTTVEVPTVFGDTEMVSVEGDGGTLYNFPGGFDVSLIPLAVPQLTIGSVKGTEALVRYFQMNISDELGDITLMGLGARHSISQYLTDFPLDLAFGFYYQTFDLANIVEASTYIFSFQAGISHGVFNLYGGLAYESGTMDISYEWGSEDDPEVISFDIRPSNSVRLTIGGALNLWIMKVHLDYSVASQSVVCAGLGFGL